MIKGVGVDIVSISRMKRIVVKWDKKFLERFFTEDELGHIYKNSMAYDTISGMFGTKEAVSKVLGTGFRSMKLKDIEVLHDNMGKPYVRLYGRARELADEEGIDSIDISISHEREYVVSFALGYGENSIAIDSSLRSLLPERNRYSHKGDYGRLGVVAGSKTMLGANYLATMAGLRTGSGLVYSIVPESMAGIMANKLIEAIIVPLKDEDGSFGKGSIEELEASLDIYDSLVLGPGLGSSSCIDDFVAHIVENYKKALLLDADGINSISRDLSILDRRKADLIITPHPGEFARLLDRDIEDIENNRIKYAVEFSKSHGLITVLKGNKTIVTDGDELYINETGNPGMATAGSGDLLSGIIGSLLSQGLESFNAAVLGVYIHGLAGDIAKEHFGEYGMIARDILASIPKAISLISS